MEAEQVAVEETLDQHAMHRQDSPDLAAGERSMEEPSDLDILLGGAELLTQHGEKQHQVVVVYPYYIIALNIFRNLLGELAIRLLICLPVGFVKGDRGDVVVEGGPEDLVLHRQRNLHKSAWLTGESIFSKTVFQKHRNSAILL